MADDALPDPFDGLPEELRRMLEQMGGADGPLGEVLGGLGGPGGLEQLLGPDGPFGAGGLEQLLGGAGGLGGALQGAFAGGTPFGAPGGAATGPVDWRLARRAALQRAGEGDHSPDAAEVTRHEEALRIAEHWLDASTLPAPPDAGRLVVASRGAWVDAALTSMRPLVEPVAAAATRAMTALAQEQLGDGAAEQLEDMGLGGLAGMLDGMDTGALLAPLGATMAGLQAGNVIGELAQHLVTGTELGLPTGPRSTAFVLVPNVEDAFDGWELEPTEVAVALALTEAAHRRLFHAVPWLEGHLQDLVATFAEGTVVDPAQLRDLADELMSGIDVEDPAALQRAMRQMGELRPAPTAAQQRTLSRIQGVTALVGAWARREVARAADGRLPGLARVEEVLRRRRAGRADGDQLLAALLGLDLSPDDASLGEGFVAHVEDALGPEGLRRAIAHPENLPDLDELGEPDAWLRRVAVDGEVPDDVVGLLESLGTAPVEASAAERLDGAPPTDGEGPARPAVPDDPRDAGPPPTDEEQDAGSDGPADPDDDPGDAQDPGAG